MVHAAINNFICASEDVAAAVYVDKRGGTLGSRLLS